MELQAQPSRGPGRSILTIVAVILLVSSLTFAALYYYQYTQSNQQISSLNSSISALQQQRSTLLQLLAANNTGSGRGGTPSGNATTINTTAIYDYANSSVVTVQGLQRTSSFFGGVTYSQVLGSGFVIQYHNSNYVISNYHVVQNDINVTVTFSNGNAFRATVVGSDPYIDLAVLSVTNAPSSQFYPLNFGQSSAVRVGQAVVAIGNPYGLAGSLTEGLVSQLGRTIQDSTAGNFTVADVIQISTPINPGNSGGPLLNAHGQVVGVTTAIVSGSQGIGFAIPSDAITKELPYLIGTGSYTMHPYMGISEADMNYDLARASGTNVTYGILVEGVVKGGPADQAGLRAGTSQRTIDGSQYLIGGDIIISINGAKIGNGDALSSWLQEHAVPGQVVQLGIIRGGTQTTISLTLGTRPSI